MSKTIPKLKKKKSAPPSAIVIRPSEMKNQIIIDIDLWSEPRVLGLQKQINDYVKYWKIK